MKVLIQRVKSASVVVNEQNIGQIDQGLLIFLGFEKNDTSEAIPPMVKKVLHYRLFSDENDKMNLNVMQVQGQILVVSQFTLAANTNKGLRPSFSSSLEPDKANSLYNEFITQLRSSDLTIATGEFGADMQVNLTNDGPVTFLLES